MDQPKIERLLRLIQLMSGPRNYSYDQLAETLEISRRSLFRYLDTFKSVGFVIVKVGDGSIPRLVSTGRKVPDMDKLVMFSEEEAYLIDHLIDRLDPTNTLKGNLKRKLEAIYDMTSPADFVDDKSSAEKVQALSGAIRGHKQVILKDYESGKSLSTQDHTVEPFAFTTNYIDIWAYDHKDGINKLFKISRIGQVEALEFEWSAESEHHQMPQDIFRMTGDLDETIVLLMTSRAKNLLIEEYPLAERDIEGIRTTVMPELIGHPKDNGAPLWRLQTVIHSVLGAGRFVMGLPGDITIEQGDALRQYIRETAEKFLLNI